MQVNQQFRPESGNWCCSKCKKPLEEGFVELKYMENSFTVGVLICPECNQALIPEEMATGRMLEVEKMLEDK